MHDPQREPLLQAIKELTTEIKRMIERIRRQLTELERKGLRKSNGRRPRRRKPPG